MTSSLSLKLIAVAAAVVSLSKEIIAEDRSWGAIACSSSPTRQPLQPAWPSGTKFRVECPPGYVYVAPDQSSDSAITCQGSGTWDKSFGSCRRVGPLCTRPDTPYGVKVVQQSGPIDESPNQFTVGSFILYACDNSAWKMSGSARIACASSGTWTTQPPMCSPQNLAAGLRCAMPVPPTNGFIDRQSQGDASGLSFPVNAFITFACNPGYAVSGPATIFCRSSGKWDRHPPGCVGDSSDDDPDWSFTAAGCDKPPIPYNGRVSFSSPGEQPSIYPPNGRIRYACNGNYRMVGQSLIECQADGTWYPTPPTCLR